VQPAGWNRDSRAELHVVQGSDLSSLCLVVELLERRLAHHLHGKYWQWCWCANTPYYMLAELWLFLCVLQTGRLEPQPGRTLMEAFEGKVNSVLNKARDDAGELASCDT
jgi:hypothetical protein